jgi:hypothetical protein
MEILAMVKVSVVWRLWLWRLAIKSTRLFFTFRMHPVRKRKMLRIWASQSERWKACWSKKQTKRLDFAT